MYSSCLPACILAGLGCCDRLNGLFFLKLFGVYGGVILSVACFDSAGQFVAADSKIARTLQQVFGLPRNEFI